MIKLFKYKNKIVCYIRKVSDSNFIVCTGKPSDSSCLAWHYNNASAAEFTACEYFNNYINK